VCAKMQVDEARDVLANVVLCHVPVVRYNFAAKVLYTAGEAARCPLPGCSAEGIFDQHTRASTGLCRMCNTQQVSHQ